MQKLYIALKNLKIFFSNAIKINKIAEKHEAIVEL